MVVGITVFAAVATPSGDPLRCSLLAGPIVVLYFVRRRLLAAQRPRRKRRDDPDAELDDDEASELDLTPEARRRDRAGGRAAARCPSRRAATADGGRTHRVNGYDDVT